MLNVLQFQALGIEEAGNAFATYELGRTSGSATTALLALAAILPLIPVGQASTEQIGSVNGQLEAALGTVPSTDTTLIDQLGSLVALVSQSQEAAQGGVQTIDQGILVTIATNAKVGIVNAVSYAKGVAEGKAAAAAAASSSTSA